MTTLTTVYPNLMSSCQKTKPALSGSTNDSRDTEAPENTESHKSTGSKSDDEDNEDKKLDKTKKSLAVKKTSFDASSDTPATLQAISNAIWQIEIRFREDARNLPKIRIFCRIDFAIGCSIFLTMRKEQL